jgi:cytosine/adenosine deaminase-related metal-dependent hydrolase
MTSRILIRGAAIVSMDEQIGELERGDILVVDGRIEKVAPSIEAADAEVIDASDMIAMPGMVDTHRHTWQTGLRGILANGTIPDYLWGIRLQMAERYRADDMYAGNYLGGLDALNQGVTTIVDYCHNILDPDYAHASVKGLLDSGVRALYGHGMVPITENTWADTKGGADAVASSSFDRRAALAREIRSTYFSSDDQRVRFGIAPQELAIAPAVEVKQEFDLARELGARITFHANQVNVRQRFKDVEVMHAHGLLGDDLLLVHCTFNTPEEWDMLDGTGTMISVCAETEMQMGMGFPAIEEVTKHTPGPSLGIDCTSSTNADMISHARLVLQVTRWHSDRKAYEDMAQSFHMNWTTQDALKWLTINGAKAAGVGDITGSLTPGKRADIVLLDMSGVSQLGWNRREPGAAVIAQTNSGNVHTVLVDGQIVKRDGRLVHVDVPAARATLESSSACLYRQMDEHGGFIPEPRVDLPLFRERA